MKKIALIATLFCCVGILAAWLSDYFIEAGKETVYIALAGPMSGFAQEEGKAMLRGATLAYEQVRKEGRLLKNKKIKIVPYDDQNSQTAVLIASNIVNENKVYLVLGHYSSSGSAAAGPVYESNGIPAITASATKEAATQESEWFFRTIPGMRAMTKSVVYRMQELPGVTSKTASIIYDVNFYDTSVAEEFEKETKNTFDTLHQWSFDSKSDSKQHDIKNIIGEIRAEQSVGPIFFAANSKDSGQIISSFRYPGTNYPIIGVDSLAVPTFIRQFESNPNEQESPGYYTNGAYAVSPFISYLADQPNALVFRKEFLRRYGKEPTWVAAGYYDAMLLALNAVEQAEVQGEDIRENRRRIRSALNRFNKKDVAVNGVTGDLYFDENGNVSFPLALGFWWNNTFLPAYQQVQLLDSDVSEQSAGDGEKYTTPLRVVYAGVDINAIRNIDLKKEKFTADFYLWFRFQGVFDDTAITFINALEPVTLKKPIMKDITGDITTRAYRVIADLKIDSKEAAYPLDRQTLRISFQHDNKTRKELIYIPDVIGIKGSVGTINRGESMLETILGWETSEIVSRQNIEKIINENKEKNSYSRIDTEITICREDRGTLLLKLLLPFLVVMTLCFVLFWFAPEKMRLRLYILLLLLSLTFGLRIIYGYILPGQEVVHYMANMMFALIFFSFLISVTAYFVQQRSYVRRAQCILYKGSIFYFVAAMAGVVYLLNSHSYLPWSLQTSSISTHWESIAWLADRIREITGPLLR